MNYTEACRCEDCMKTRNLGIKISNKYLVGKTTVEGLSAIAYIIAELVHRAKADCGIEEALKVQTVFQDLFLDHVKFLIENDEQISLNKFAADIAEDLASEFATERKLKPTFDFRQHLTSERSNKNAPTSKPSRNSTSRN